MKVIIKKTTEVRPLTVVNLDMVKEENGSLFANGSREEAQKLAKLPFVKTVKHNPKANIIVFTVEDDVRLIELEKGIILFEQCIDELHIMGIKL